MLSIYPACFFKEENGYSVIFPLTLMIWQPAEKIWKKP